MKNVLPQFTIKLAVFSTLAVLPSVVFAGPVKHTWDKYNDPKILNDNYEYRLSELPLTGSADLGHRGWSDSYWPYQKGMIAYRYLTQTDFDEDKSPSHLAMKTMSEEDIKLLAPSEKLDLAMNRFDFPLTKSLRKKFNGREREWRGVCNGWAHASLYFDEPQPFVYENDVGIKIPFGSSDVKALLAYYYAKVDPNITGDTKVLGTRCSLRPGMSWLSGACSDLDAGAFHVVMANELGIKKMGFTADRDSFNEVWNHPFVSYQVVETKVLRDIARGDRMRGLSDETVQEISVVANAVYVDDDQVEPSYEPFIKNGTNKLTTVRYEYTLELDVAGNIIGGEWITEMHPDFIWMQNFEAPKGKYAIIQKLYELSQPRVETEAPAPTEPAVTEPVVTP